MSIDNRKLTAAEAFRTGLNCAQSVLTAYAEELNLNSTSALEIASGFGGGMGRLQQTCGAVTGSFMVIGIINSRDIHDDVIRGEQTPAMIQKFNNEFLKRNSSTNCSELLNCDLKTNAGQEYFTNNNLGRKVCQKCISDSIEILESIKSSAKY